MGREIAAARTRRRWLQSDLALAAGVNLRTVQRYEQNGPTKIDDALKIAEALGMTLSDLTEAAERALSDVGSIRQAGP